MAGPPPNHVAAQIVIKIHNPGAKSIEGPMDEREWVLACLQNAIDAVRAHRRPSRGLIVPSKDVDLGPVRPAGLTLVKS